ncbi:hypothetical protein [Candidatus Parabeggiatoa sp. HSG14]|nr:hypothetical protein [Thiotrichales bacterium HSG14]
MSKKKPMNKKSDARIQRAAASRYAGFVPKNGFSSHGQAPTRNTGRKK